MITEQDLEELVVGEEYVRMATKVTVCVLTLANGFELVGYSACVDPSDFNVETGQKYAREHAISKLWELEGYRRH